MDTTRSIIRIATLLSLFVTAMFCILSFPVDDSSAWFAGFLISKSIGVACVWLLGKAYTRWADTDKLITRLEAWCINFKNQIR